MRSSAHHANLFRTGRIVADNEPNLPARTRPVKVRCRHGGGREVLRTGWTVSGVTGLALHASTSDRHGDWTVTHLSTGLGVVFGIAGIEDAILIIQALDAGLRDGGVHIDWTATAEDLEHPRVQDAMEFAMARVKALWPEVTLGPENDDQVACTSPAHPSHPKETPNV